MRGADRRGGGATPSVARIRVRAIPGSRVDALVGPHGDAWKIRVVAAPEQGRANAAICTLIATIAGVSPRHVRVVRGTSSRDKLVEIDGVDHIELVRMLDAASGK